MTGRHSGRKLGTWILVGSAVGVCLASGAAVLRSTGIDGFSSNPATNGGQNCNLCHFGGVTPEVSLAGPTVVQPGQTYAFTFTIRGGQEVAGGLDVSVTDGALNVTDPDLRIQNSEVVHNSMRDADANGEVTWSFDWTAPAATGPVDMYASGNSVNQNWSTTGDAANSTQISLLVCSPGSWSNYGAGLAGTNGVPGLALVADPVIGGLLTLLLDNSLGAPTTGLLFVGLSATSQPTAWGGTLLVVPALSKVLPVAAGGLSLSGTLPDDPLLCGTSIFLQAVEIDAGASRGFSFTPGLEMVPGS